MAARERWLAGERGRRPLARARRVLREHARKLAARARRKRRVRAELDNDAVADDRDRVGAPHCAGRERAGRSESERRRIRENYYPKQ